MISRRLIAAVLLALCGATARAGDSAPPTAASFEKNLAQLARPFFAEHCIRCHGPKKQEGDLRLDTLAIDFQSPKVMGHWEELMNRVNSGDMPPDDEPRPKPDDVARLADFITAMLREGEIARQSTGQTVAFNRLSREEYANTIRDLLGVTFDASDPSGLPEDPDWQGFQRIGSVLTLSPAHVEKYMAAAELVLDEALGLGPQPKRELTHWSPFEIRGWKAFEQEYRQRGIADKTRVDLFPNNGALDSRDLRLRVPGEYRVRVKASGLRPENGRTPRLRLYAGDLDRLVLERDVLAPEDQPAVIEARVHLPAGNHQIRIVNAVPGPNPTARRSRSTQTANAFTSLDTRVPWQLKFTDDDGRPLVPFILLDWIEWEGPLVAGWPTPTYEQIFFAGDSRPKDLVYAREILSRFSEHAWRRPVETPEIDRLVALVAQAQKLGDNFDASIKTGLVAVLCSKNFLYLQEGQPADSHARLNDWELASRLSYFLWSSMPDERLFALAGDGRLHDPEVLRWEVRRMLADPKAADFADAFARQWLQLRKVGMFPPDKVLYPEYDDYLEQSMIAEPLEFFRTVLDENRSLREFLDSDWTMLNERLAEHYGIPGVHGEAMRQVKLSEGDHRGGLLTAGAILSLTSDGTRHRPVHRGVWMLESIIGKPPPPPPANVPALGTPAANVRKTTVREKLEQHRADPKCAACHRKIDPLGLAFDNYDAIGRWRTVETVRDGTGSDPRLDPSGALPDGRRFADCQALKRLLAEDIDRFAAAFIEKLATYALRRGMNFSDREQLKLVAQQAKAADYRLATIIELLATSAVFAKR